MIEIDVDGRRRRVALRRDGNQWLAGIDGREMTVTVVEAAGRWSMLIGPPEGGHYDPDPDPNPDPNVVSGFSRTGPDSNVVSGFSRTRQASYDIAFEPGSGGELIVYVNGVAVPLTVADRRRRGRQGAGDATGTQPRMIVAPMPGRIVKVLVQPGEVVQPRQGLVVVEAMKMENELRAPRSGTVAEVRVREGASVEANAVLVVLR